VAKLKRATLRHAGWTRAGAVAVAAAVLLLWVTGVLLHVWPADSTFELAPWQQELRRIALVLHGCTVWVLCFLAGHWLWTHVATVWHRRRHSTWMTGTITGVVLVVVAGTGLLLLYGPEPLRVPSAIVHWWTAVGLPVLLALHSRAWWLRT
jgi:hypothetical protein